MSKNSGLRWCEFNFACYFPGRKYVRINQGVRDLETIVQRHPLILTRSLDAEHSIFAEVVAIATKEELL